MATSPKKSLLQVLGEKRKITIEQARQAVTLRQTSGDTFENTLVEMGVPENDVYEAKAELEGVTFLDLETVEVNPEVRFGKPIVKGTRTTVAEVLEMLANGMSAADIQEDFPVLGPEQIRACLLYAARRESIELMAS